MKATKNGSIFHYMTNKQAVMCLTFIAGFIDGGCFVLLHGVFTTSITGNIVVVVYEIYKSQAGFAARGLAILGIGVGSGCMTMYAMKLNFRTSLTRWQIGFRLYLCQFVALLATVLIGSTWELPDVNSPTVLLVAFSMSFTMGLQNGASFAVIPNCPMTTAMTGNTVRLFVNGAEALGYWLASRGLLDLYPEQLGKPAEYDARMRKSSRELARRFRVFLATLLPFAAGVALSIPLELAIGFKCMVLPLLVVLWLLFCIHAGDRRSREEAELLVSTQSPVVDAAEAEAANAAAIEGNKSSGLAESAVAEE